MKIFWLFFWFGNCFGYFFQNLGEFFPQSSGHPARIPVRLKNACHASVCQGDLYYKPFYNCDCKPRFLNYHLLQRAPQKRYRNGK
jgi:hypothetical protein